MVASVIECAQERGWEAEAIFPREAADAEWHADLALVGCQARSARRRRRRSSAKWARELPLARGALTGDSSTRISRPTTFRRRIAASPGELAVVWHNHTALNERPDVVVEEFLKFTIGGRSDRGRHLSFEGPRGGGGGAGGLRRRRSGSSRTRSTRPFSVVSEERRTEARERWRSIPTPSSLLSFAWHWQMKGGELYQRAIAKLAEKADRKLVALHSTTAPEARQLMASSDLSDRFDCRCSPTMSRRSWRQCDVFVSASEVEGGTPLAVLEALSSGVAVVASDLPSHRYVAEPRSRR